MLEGLSLVFDSIRLWNNENSWSVSGGAWYWLLFISCQSSIRSEIKLDLMADQIMLTRDEREARVYCEHGRRPRNNKLGFFWIVFNRNKTITGIKSQDKCGLIKYFRFTASPQNRPSLPLQYRDITFIAFHFFPTQSADSKIVHWKYIYK